MPTQAIAIPNRPGVVIGPREHKPPKLVMSPPNMQPWEMSPVSLSPLHMSPPNMLLPNFSPIQDHMPLPVLTASRFSPPSSFLTHYLDLPPSAAIYSRTDPTVLAVGTFSGTGSAPESPRPQQQRASVVLFRVSDVKRQVRGDEIVAAGVAEPRQKIRPQLQQMSAADTPSSVSDLKFSPYDSEILLATTVTGEVLIFDVDYHQCSLELLSTHHVFDQSTTITRLEFSPTDASLFAVATSGGTVALVKLPDDYEQDDGCKIFQRMQPHSKQACAIAFSKDGKRLYTGGEDDKLTSWAFGKRGPRQAWVDKNSHDSGVTAITTWPHFRGADRNQKRKLLLTGSYDGNFRVIDMSEPRRPPPVVQEEDLEGGIWSISALPPLPKLDEIDDLGPGVFSPDRHPDIPIDPAFVGVIVSCMSGGSRLLVQKPKFEELYLEGDDNGKDKPNDFDHFTVDGVEKDWYGREREYYWYNVANFEEHDGRCYASAAVSIIDYDPLFKDSGKQRLRRGWRIASTGFNDRSLSFWQVYVE